MTAEYRDGLAYEGFTDGLDVSSVQIITDARAVYDAGFRFATVKAAEGALSCDPRALEHLHKLREAGLICNVYTFVRPSQGHPREQVERAMACAGDVFPGRLAIDLEAAPETMTPDELVLFGEEAADAALEHGALEPEVYLYPDFTRRRLQPALARSARLGRCPLWMAHYGSMTRAWAPPRAWTPWLCAPWSTWTKHQYSGNNGYRVRGIAGDVDRNLFHGDLAAFRSYMGLPELAGAGDDGTRIVRAQLELAPPSRGDD